MLQHHLTTLLKSGDFPFPMVITPIVLLTSFETELLFRAPSPEARLEFIHRLGHHYTIPRTTFSCLPFCSFLKLNFYASIIFPIIFIKLFCNRLVFLQYPSHTWLIIFKIPVSNSILLYMSCISVSFYYLLHPENNLQPTTMTVLFFFSLLFEQHFLLIQSNIGF